MATLGGPYSGYHEDQALIRSLELSALLFPQPQESRERLEIKLKIHHAYVMKSP